MAEAAVPYMPRLPSPAVVRNREIECRAFPDLGFNPDCAAVPFNDFLTYRQPDATARDLHTVQPLERFKDSFVILRRNADAVVAAREAVRAALPFRADVD